MLTYDWTALWPHGASAWSSCFVCPTSPDGYCWVPRAPVTHTPDTKWPLSLAWTHKGPVLPRAAAVSMTSFCQRMQGPRQIYTNGQKELWRDSLPQDWEGEAPRHREPDGDCPLKLDIACIFRLLQAWSQERRPELRNENWGKSAQSRKGNPRK